MHKSILEMDMQHHSFQYIRKTHIKIWLVDWLGL